MTFWLVQPGAKTCRHTFPLAIVQCNAISESVAGLLSTEAFKIVGGCNHSSLTLDNFYLKGYDKPNK